MGMYTEFIFGCELSKDTPKECIDALDYTINGEDKQPKYENPKDWKEKRYNEQYIEWTTSKEDIEKFCDKFDFWRLFHSCSAYFGAANPISKFYWDPISKSYHISTRADLKNYSNQIENFIEYIKPYVKHGSGYDHHIFAYVQYEEAEFPTIYGVDGVYSVMDPEIRKEYEQKNNDWYKSLQTLYSKLAPEYVITEAELGKRNLDSGYSPTYAECYNWMTEYIVNKYQNQHPVISEQEINIILDTALYNVFKVHYNRGNEADRFTKKELEHHKEIQAEFAKLLSEKYDTNRKDPKN